MASRKTPNSFFEIIALLLSLVLGIFRSIRALFGTPSKRLKNNTFFNLLHFLFSVWPKYFWQAPSLYKLMRFPGDVTRYILKR